MASEWQDLLRLVLALQTDTLIHLAVLILPGHTFGKVKTTTLADLVGFERSFDCDATAQVGKFSSPSVLTAR